MKKEMLGQANKMNPLPYQKAINGCWEVLRDYPLAGYHSFILKKQHLTVDICY